MKPARFALVALMCALFGLAVARAADKAPAVMATAANRLLESLTPEQKVATIKDVVTRQMGNVLPGLLERTR